MEVQFVPVYGTHQGGYLTKIGEAISVDSTFHETRLI